MIQKIDIKSSPLLFILILNAHGFIKFGIALDETVLSRILQGFRPCLWLNWCSSSFKCRFYYCSFDPLLIKLLLLLNLLTFLMFEISPILNSFFSIRLKLLRIIFKHLVPRFGQFLLQYLLLFVSLIQSLKILLFFFETFEKLLAHFLDFDVKSALWEGW